METYEGGCHCGSVRLRVRGDLANASLCNCSICTMKGYLHLVVPREQFELLQGEDAMSTYTFGTHVAKHIFCQHCGVSAFYVPRARPDGVSVNIRCLDGVDVDSMRPNAFDGRNWEVAMRARLRS